MRLVPFFDRMIYYLLCLLLMASVLVIFGSIVLRSFNLPIFWAEEVATLLFVWIIYLGAMIAFQKNRHVAMELIYKSCSPACQTILEVMGQTLLGALLVILVIASARLFIVQLHTLTPALMIPYAIFSLSALISFGYMLGISLRQFGMLINRLRGKPKFQNSNPVGAGDPS